MAIRAQETIRRCAACQSLFMVSVGSGQRYCRRKCKFAAAHRRAMARHRAARAPRRCQTCARVLPVESRLSRRYCGVRCRTRANYVVHRAAKCAAARAYSVSHRETRRARERMNGKDRRARAAYKAYHHAYLKAWRLKLSPAQRQAARARRWAYDRHRQSTAAYKARQAAYRAAHPERALVSVTVGKEHPWLLDIARLLRHARRAVRDQYRNQRKVRASA